MPPTEISTGKQKTINQMLGVLSIQVDEITFDPKEFRELGLMTYAEEYTLLRYIIGVPLGMSFKTPTRQKTVKFDNNYKNTLGKRPHGTLRSKAEALSKSNKDLINKYKIEEKHVDHLKKHMLRKKE